MPRYILSEAENDNTITVDAIAEEETKNPKNDNMAVENEFKEDAKNLCKLFNDAGYKTISDSIETEGYFCVEKKLPDQHVAITIDNAGADDAVDTEGTLTELLAAFVNVEEGEAGVYLASEQEISELANNLKNGLTRANNDIKNITVKFNAEKAKK